jgi:iron(II)-dependent oxidoreductase
LTRLGIDAAEYPVRGIDFKSASDYCAWRNQRLPTEEEWEFAARGLDHRLFAWGNEPRMALSGTAAKVKPVNEQPITGLFGAAGLGDGLLEWVDGGKPNERLLRGSSWLDTNVADERLARRRLIDPSFALLDTGFRCAQSAERWPDQGLPGGS